MFVRRDKILGLFWPESDERRARSSLSETLSRLRGSLGPNVIVTRGSDEIGISPDHLWCDAADLLVASERGDKAEIANLYRGALLDGFFLDDGGGFDH
jgi:serine/threonine-protein kinase